MLSTTQKLFELEYRRIGESAWHESVETYDIYEAGTRIGRFHLDMHPREGKYKHAAAFPLQSGVCDRQIPEAALVCNFPGGDGTLGLMEHDQVVTFFHELGHLLHHILGGRHRWVEVSGLNVEWDFVEVPSQMLEEWAWDEETLQAFARNDDDEPIPTELIARRVRGGPSSASTRRRPR